MDPNTTENVDADVQLVRAAQQDPAAFEALYRKWLSLLAPEFVINRA